MVGFFALPLLTIFAISLSAIVAAIEGGRLLGRRARAMGGDNAGTLEAAVLGLLALIIAFTVAIAISRYDTRREAVLEEANAIGTAGLRASLLPAPHDDAAIASLRQYVDVRLTLTRRVHEPAALKTAIERSNEILNELWLTAETVARVNDGMVPTGLFIEALNQLIDEQETRLAALRARVPPIVLVTMYGIAIVAAGFVGYSTGLDPARRRLPPYVLSILVAAIILLIQDLDRPGEGFIVVSQQPLVDAAASLRALEAQN